MEYIHHKNAVYLLNYHVVFVVKYRRKVITKEMSEYLKVLADRLVSGYGGSLIEMESDMDHVHMLLSLPPSQTPSRVVCSLKTQFSKELRAKFTEEIRPQLWGDAFWSPSYFISTTGGVTLEVIKSYIESQQTEEHRRKYIKSGKYSKAKKKA